MFATNIEMKANILNLHFLPQCSTIDNSSTLLSVQPTCHALVQSFEIDREKLTRFIGEVDSTKAHGCNDKLISMITICDTSSVESLCLILGKSLETASISLYGRKNILSLFIRKEADMINIIILSLESKFFGKFLKKFF